MGDFWVYRWNGSQSVTIQVVGVDLIDGVLTGRTRWSGGPFDRLEGNTSFDSFFGSRLWRSFRPDVFIDGVGFVDQLQEFNPPLVSSLPLITIGEVVASEGPIVQTLFTDFGTFVQPGTVRATYRYALIEPVSVPFGTFDSIQRRIQLDLTLEVSPGQFQSVRATSRDWLAAGLGSIRIEQDLPDGLNVFELLDTNREFVPEPMTPLLRLPALGVLAALAWRVRKVSA